MSHHQEKIGWGILAGLILFVLWLMGKSGAVSYLHGASTVKLINNDSLTGVPQFDSSDSATLPACYANGVLPLGSPQEGATGFPANPLMATCPAGYQLWKDKNSGAYVCLPC
jgi:hypothetical protein